ncbi:MAG TPA: hypothetical protein HA257_07750 [Candidatus Methanoperedenaceae archaeon]|nr:hypothetical protein [Candidatus Methanoperedenaceae archaeon]
MSAVEVIRKVAENEVKKLNLIELGVVTSVLPHADAGDYDNYECNVKLKNRELELRRVPIATQRIGLTYVPNVGDMVLLAFVSGDINAPVVIGRLYNDDDRPPVNKEGELVYESPDPKKSGVRRLYMKFPGGTVLTVTDDELRAEVGKSIVTVKTDGDVTVESNAAVGINAKGDITLSGQNVKIESKASLELKAGAGAKLEASANLDIKGAMVNIN